MSSLPAPPGFVGSGVLDAMIKMKDIQKISILSRRPVPMTDHANDPRIHVIVHQDFETYDSELLDKLKGAKGCVWALEISSTQVGTEYANKPLPAWMKRKDRLITLPREYINNQDLLASSSSGLPNPSITRATLPLRLRVRQRCKYRTGQVFPALFSH